MKKLFCIVAVMLIAFFVSKADAEHKHNHNKSAKVLKWETCATAAAVAKDKFYKKNPTQLMKDLCAYIEMPVGDECNLQMQMIQMSGQVLPFNISFLIDTTLMPACGQQPKG